MKTRTALTWYKLGRKCISCDTMIVDVNKSGYCAGCYRRYRAAHKQGARETSAHRLLKQRAIAFLVAMGCVDIQEEYTIGMSFNGKGSIRVDVAGFMNDELIVVECGGSTSGKLDRAWSYIKEIWILPYGELAPFRWQRGKSICHTCGHTI